jgi:hypothetical protein
MQFAEGFYFFEGQIKAGEVKPAVDKHRAVTRGEHEAIAVDPLRGRGVVAEEVAVEDGTDFSGAQGQAEVTRMTGSHGVHGKAAGFGGGTGKVGGIIERHIAYR